VPPPGYEKSIAKVSDLIGSQNTGVINASKVNPYALLVDIGPTRTNTKKGLDEHGKEKVIWSKTTANHTLFICQMDDVIPSKRITKRDPETGAITFLGEWDKKTLGVLAQTGDKTRKPDPKHRVTLRPGVFSIVRMEVGTSKKGDIVRMVDAHLRVSINQPDSAYGPESGWFEATRCTPLPRVDPIDRTNMYFEGNILTTYLPPPDLEGSAVDYSDPKIDAYAFIVGPDSMLEDPDTGEFFKLELVPSRVRYSISQRAPLGWKESDIKNPGEQPFLEVLVAGIQRHKSYGGYEDSKFIWKTTIWPSGEVSDSEGNNVRYLSSEMEIFGIMSLKMWTTLMPVYFPLMDVIYVVRPNATKTALMMGSIMGSSGSHAISGDHAFSRSDRLGVVTSAVDAHDDDMGGMEDAMEDPKGKGRALDSDPSGSGDARAEPMYDEDTPNMDFGYDFYISKLEFDTKSFWVKHGLCIPVDVAKSVVALIRPDESTLIPDPEYIKKDFTTLKREKQEREVNHANRIMGNTDVICVSCKFPNYSRLFDAKHSQNIERFVAVVPWRNYRAAYPEHIANMSTDMQTSLFIHLYNFYEKLTAKTGKRTEEQIAKNAKIFAPPVSMDSKEWKNSGAEFIYNNEEELRDSKWDLVTPGIFAVWKMDESERSLGQESIQFLFGDHPNQANFVEKVRGPAEDAAVPPPVPKKPRVVAPPPNDSAASLSSSSGEEEEDEEDENGDDEESSDDGISI